MLSLSSLSKTYTPKRYYYSFIEEKLILLYFRKYEKEGKNRGLI
jgi:hypothetical protein